VLTWQDLLLKDLRALTLLDTCDLENLSGIDKRITASAHHSNAANHTLIDLQRDATVSSVRGQENGEN